MRLYAPAKVNLCLRVLKKRPDGYHNIETIFERIALFDSIYLRSLPASLGVSGRIKVFCNNPDVPTGKDSLIYRTAALIRDRARISEGAEIRIFKKIPIAAGLGGGSSDAASVLKGLNKMWKASLGNKELISIGSTLGSDIPFFLSGKTFALGSGRGDIVKPLGWKSKFWHIIIYCGAKLLSGDVYGSYSRKLSPGAGEVPVSDYPRGLRKWNLHGKITSLKKCVKVTRRLRDSVYFAGNDLENIVLKKIPVLSMLKNAMGNTGLGYSLVSGSGPSVFALFTNRKEAVEARKALVKRFPVIKKKGWQIFVVSTL
ncbi:MAG: 4-(cytidine 5'-diphospho)-2-C-methyl-D-erythritol kinase [Candidatus Omnitrophica bacterium]|nr:4-(cytidine 5'-diphospho)-2-C-methyl-D-erythritol kinase [Candidatus Omnitrophota bacterium]